MCADKSVDAKGEDKSRRKDSIASLNSSEVRIFTLSNLTKNYPVE